MIIPTTYTLFDRETRLPLGHLRCVPEQLASNVRTGQIAMEGEYDLHATRLDESEQVASYQPPRPDVDHEWDGTARRWVKKADAIARDNISGDASRQINSLEASQARALREIALGDANGEARRRLEQIDAQIADLRKAL